MIELADIFNTHGDEYLSKFQGRILPSHIKAIKSIKRCRTPALGGQVYSCNKCNLYDYSYHSCNNRNCSKCGGDKTETWIKKQFNLLLPTPYFFVTFTLPEELRYIVRSNQKYFYNIFFKASSEALKILSKDKRFVDGDIGFMGVLQTWARNLIYHPHIHYIVPGVALSHDRKKYIKIKNSKFLVHVKPLSLLFKRLFKESLQTTEFYKQISTSVWYKDWVVHCEPAGYGQEIIKYVAPYVYRVALSNNKIKSFRDRFVTFQHQDFKTKQNKICTLDVIKFISRFLQHVLPHGFTKVRYFGIMGSNVKDKWFLLKHLLFKNHSLKKQKLFLKINFKSKSKKVRCCNNCGGVLNFIGVLPRGP